MDLDSLINLLSELRSKHGREIPVCVTYPDAATDSTDSSSIFDVVAKNNNIVITVYPS